MGFFSWDCRECGHPMLSEYATNHINNWMRDVVVVEHDGNIVKGEYDGYGRVFFSGGWEDHELKYGTWTARGNCLNEPSCWHKACWELAGKPTNYEPSAMSADQGYFFKDEHDMEQPTKEEA
mgnify:CR=1 FL=1